MYIGLHKYILVYMIGGPGPPPGSCSRARALGPPPPRGSCSRARALAPPVGFRTSGPPRPQGLGFPSGGLWVSSLDWQAFSHDFGFLFKKGLPTLFARPYIKSLL